MVAGSSGYSPATPRIPSVPNSSFPTISSGCSLLLHGDCHGYLRRGLEADVRVFHEGVDVKLSRAYHSRYVYRVGDHGPDPGNMTGRPHHRQLPRQDFPMRHAITMLVFSGKFRHDTPITH